VLLGIRDRREDLALEEVGRDDGEAVAGEAVGEILDLLRESPPRVQEQHGRAGSRACRSDIAGRRGSLPAMVDGRCSIMVTT
jgi:hypothetical protein